MVGFNILIDVDVINNDSFDVVFGKLKDEWGIIDFLVYVIVYLDKNEFIGCFINISCDNFCNLMMISCYLFIDVSCCVLEMMLNGGLFIMLIYVGSNCVVLNYNVMGVVKVVLESMV